MVSSKLLVVPSKHQFGDKSVKDYINAGQQKKLKSVEDGIMVDVPILSAEARV